MASVKEIVNLNRFRGLNQGLNADLLENEELVQCLNVKVLNGKLKQQPPLTTYGSNVVASDTIKLIARVYVSAYLKAAFVGTFAGNYAYLVIYGVHGAMVVNPENFTDTVDLLVIAQDNIGGTSMLDLNSTPSRGSRYITGWRYDTLREVANDDEVRFTINRLVSGAYQVYIRLGTSTTTYTGSFSSSSESGGSEVTITVNGISTDLIAWYPGSIEAGLASPTDESFPSDTDSLGGRSFSYKIQSDTVGYERFTAAELQEISAWDEPCSYCYFNEELIFSWYGRIYKFNGDTVVSLGDGPIYGQSVENFYNHIFVGQYKRSWDFNNLYDTVTRGPNVPFDEGDRLYSVGWSDVNAADVFYPQQINEADVFVIEKSIPLDSNYPGITALGTYNDRCYIFTEQNVFEFAYVGLPLVMQSRNLYSIASCALPNCLAKTPLGVVVLDYTGQLKLMNGTEVTEIGDQINLRGLNYDSFRLNSGISDFTDTYRDSRFPGYLYLNYDRYNNELVLTHYEVNGAATAADTYNVSIYEHILELESNSWSKHYLGNNRIVLEPYTALEVPLSNWVNAIGDSRVRLRLLNRDVVGSFDSDLKVLSATHTNIIPSSVGGTLTNNVTKIVIEPKLFLFNSPEYYVDLNHVSIELSGNRVAQVNFTVENFENLSTAAHETNAQTVIFDGASTQKLVKFNIRQRVKYARLLIEIIPDSYQYGVEVKAIIINYTRRSSHVES